MSQQEKIYRSKAAKKWLVFIAAFLGLLVVMLVVVIIFPLKLPVFAIALAGALTTTWSSFPKIYVNQNQIHFKVMLNKFNCPFDQGQFKLVEITGIQAFMRNFSIHAVGIEYHPTQSKKITSFGWMLDQSEVQEIYAYIQSQHSAQPKQLAQAQS